MYIILLTIGIAFALTYALVITIGWAKTRHNRRTLQDDEGYLEEYPTLILDSTIPNPPKTVRTFSLAHNTFLDADGSPIDTTDFDPYIAIGTSTDHPHIHPGDLLLIPKETTSSSSIISRIAHIIPLPDISNHR